MLNIHYTYRNKWSKEYKIKYNSIHSTRETYCVIAENATILPQQPGDLIWGVGGCVNETGELILESSLPGTFGGAYDIKEEPQFIDDEIIYIPIIPNHWGHFLIDTVSRLWILLDKQYYREGMKIYYCSWRFSNGMLSDQYLEFFHLCGIRKEQLQHVSRPVKARRVMIPSASLGFSGDFSVKYRDVIDHVVFHAMQQAEQCGLKPRDKIYFTRTALKSSQSKEVGEMDIQKQFQLNGYAVFSPEKLTLVEQIFYIHSCKEFACLSGTIPHNLIFGNEHMTVAILNRTPVVNWPQVVLCKLYSEIKTYIIDVYHPLCLLSPSEYGSGPFWIVMTDCFIRYFQNRGYTIQDVKKNGLLKYSALLCYYRLCRNKVNTKIYYYLRNILDKKKLLP